MKLCRKTTFLGRLSKKAKPFWLIFDSVCISLPSYFAVYVEQTTSNGSFKLILIFYGASIYFKLYLLFLFFIDTVRPLLPLLWINSISVIKFKHAMERHADLTGNQLEARKAKRRFTKIVFLLTAITSVTRIIDMVTSILNRITMIYPTAFDQGTLELILFSKNITYSFINIALAFDALVYLRMDKNIVASCKKWPYCQ